MVEWKEYKLGEVCSRLRSGKGIKANSVFNTGRYPVIGGNGVRGYANESNFEGQAAVIGRQGAYCGNVRFFEGEAYMTEHAVVAVGNEHADTRFLACLLSLMHLGNLSAQSAQPGISVQTLSKQLVRLPSISYQKRVSAIIKSLDNKIEVNRQINDNFYSAFFEIMLIWLVISLENDNLEKQAQALFKSWFVDFEPFKDGYFEESELGMIPKGWKAGSLEDITTQKSERVGDRDDVKVLSPVTTGQLMLSEEFFTKQVFSESIAKYKVVEIGDFAYNPARVNIGSLGRNNYDFDGCVSPVYVVFSCKDGYVHLFDLYRKTEKFKTEVNLRAIGGVRQSLNYKDFAFIQCIIPPLHVVEKFNAIYDHLLVMQKHTEEENDRLASIRDTLLPRLMSGELKVNEIENVI
jgi:type I restriction enzyme S subunit